MSTTTALLKIAKKEDYHKLIELLDQNQDALHSIDPKTGQGLLHFAIQSESQELFNILTHRPNLDLELPTRQGQLPLQMAVRLNNCFIVTRLLEAGVNYRKKGVSGQSVLHLALRNQTDKDIIKKLTSNNRFDLNQPIESHGSYLNLAIQARHSDNFYFLIKDDTVDYCKAQDEQGNTSLLLAVKGNKGDFVISILDRLKEDKVLTDLDKQFFINHQNNQGNTAIHVAVLKNMQTITQLLQKAGNGLGIDLTLTNKKGMTYLDIKSHQEQQRLAEIEMEKRRQEEKVVRKKQKNQQKVRQKEEQQIARLEEIRRKKEVEQRLKVQARVKAETEKKKSIWIILILTVIILGGMYLAFVNTIEKKKPVTL